MDQSSGKLAHWLAFYMCKGLGIKTLLALSHTHPLESLFDLNQSELQQLGLTQNQACNLLNTNWQQVNHYEQQIQQLNITVVCIFDALYPNELKHIASAPNGFDVTLILSCIPKFLPQAANQNIYGTRKQLSIYTAQLIQYFITVVVLSRVLSQ